MNSNNDLHTEATKAFITRADAVVWVLNYSQAATKNEVLELAGLPEGCKPIAVVNQIDDHDEEEGAVDSILEDVRRRLGQTVVKVVGVSARSASKALSEDDQALLRQSRWPDFQSAIETELIAESQRRKVTRVRERAVSLLDEIRRLLAVSLTTLEESASLLGDGDQYQMRLEAQAIDMQELLDAWSVCSSRTVAAVIRTAPALPESMEDAARLNRQREQFIGVYEALEAEEAALGDQDKGYRKRVAAYDSGTRQHQASVEKWKQSGIFGGEPWISKLIGFDGTGDRLKLEAQNLATERSGLTRLRFQSGADHFRYWRRLKRSDREALQCLRQAERQIGKVCRRLRRQIKDREGTIRKAKRSARQSLWALDAIEAANSNIARPIFSSPLLASAAFRRDERLDTWQSIVVSASTSRAAPAIRAEALRGTIFPGWPVVRIVILASAALAAAGYWTFR